ncbi:2'-5' RNA ligase family protein [Terrimonas sp. NA20]|uniref:2'-5' RNA ligase family protein n=1 Tax=Terrimonas ginsenosidimutans TaxID=2908004 RepID=A0ABS9KNT4_9BACT|nr:2'-5' RNA ligase family protein [Terrimonas ginsenosidimutans]MCG2613944.1 2'-5' RNA ligase family protein [Terrimonas ginsenosidimutans]
MQKDISTLSTYRSSEYLLVLNPHEELRDRIGKVKQEFAEKFKAQQAVWSKPHLTLVRFTQLEMMEERILNCLKVKAMSQYPFKVELKNFGSFPSHSIYVTVTTKEPIRELVKEIKKSQRLLKFDKEHKPHFIDEPHLTIARKLLPWQYEQSWLEYSSKNFTGRFIADGMILLKKRENDKSYHILKRFEFQNLPVNTKQGVLF